MDNMQLIKIVKSVAEIGKVIEAVRKAESNLGRAMAVLSLTDEAMDLMSMDIDALKKEFSTLDEKGIEQLKLTFDHNFDLQNDFMEEVIEQGFAVVIEISEAVNLAIDLAKRIKPK